jgi:hypothetical protein
VKGVLAAFAAVISSAACLAQQSTVRGYVLPAADGLPLDQVARVVAVNGPKNSETRFSGLFGADRKEIRVRRFPATGVSGTQLTLTPGKYYFGVSCQQAVGDPRLLPMSMTVSAGHTYSVWCDPVPWSSPMIRFKDQIHAEWDAGAAP